MTRRVGNRPSPRVVRRLLTLLVGADTLAGLAACGGSL